MLRYLLIVLVLAGVAACARPTGDFGRAAPGYLHDVTLPAMGRAAAAARGEPISDFNLTDEEREMHDRTWRFVVAPHASDWFHDVAAEMQRTRNTGATDHRFTPERYYDHLRAIEYRSSRVRYQRVTRDAEADVATVPATFAVICAVEQIDRRRAAAAAAVAPPGSPEHGHVAARKAENDRHVGWFTRALRYRYDSYTLAMERLLIETPHEEAFNIDAQLSLLAIAVGRAERGDFCGDGVHGDGRHGPVIPSRIAAEPFSPDPFYAK